MPYLTNFLPAEKLHASFVDAEVDPYDEIDDPEKYARGYHVDIKESRRISAAELNATRTELADIANSLTWRTHPNMLWTKGWFGITRLVPDRPQYEPYNDLSREDIDAEDEGVHGYQGRRPLLVAICHEYIDALKRYKVDTEPHLRARFLCGYTIAHEIGHVVWAQDYQSNRPYNEMGYEPFVAKDKVQELGSSFMSWIFGGFDPNVQEINRTMFEEHLIVQWRPSGEPPMAAGNADGRLPRRDGLIEYTLSIKFMEDILNKSVWDAIRGSKNTVAWSSAVRARFLPDIQNSAVATKKAKPQRKPTDAFSDEFSDEYEDYQQQKPFDVEDCDYSTNAAIRGEIFDGNLRVDNEAEYKDSEADQLPMKMVTIFYHPAPGALTEDGTFTPRTRSSQDRSKKRRRSDVDDNGNSGGYNSNKRLRTADARNIDTLLKRIDEKKLLEDLNYIPWSADFDKHLRFGDEKYNCQNVHDVLQHISVTAVESLSIIEAFMYTLKQEFAERFPFDIEGTDAWQEQKLDRTMHMDLISQIRIFRLRKAYEMFAEKTAATQDELTRILGLQSCIAINQEQIRSMAEYSTSVKNDILKSKTQHEPGYPASELPADPDESRRWLSNHYISMMERAQAELRRLLAAQDDMEIVAAAQAPAPAAPAEDLDQSLKDNNLPLWGDDTTKRARLDMYNLELRNPNGVSRNKTLLNHTGKHVGRIDEHGRERYVFGACLEFTYVSTLKDAIFKTGMFPSDCELKLWFGSMSEEMADWDMLADYGTNFNIKKDPRFSKLILTVTRPDPPPQPPREKGKAIYPGKDLQSSTARASGSGSAAPILRADAEGRVFDARTGEKKEVIIIDDDDEAENDPELEAALRASLLGNDADDADDFPDLEATIAASRLEQVRPQGNGESSSSSRPRPQRTDYSWLSQPRPARASAAPAYVNRAAAIVADPSIRTMAERAESLAHDQAQMSSAVAGVTNTRELVDNLADIRDRERERQRLIASQLREAEAAEDAEEVERRIALQNRAQEARERTLSSGPGAAGRRRARESGTDAFDREVQRAFHSSRVERRRQEWRARQQPRGMSAVASRVEAVEEMDEEEQMDEGADANVFYDAVESPEERWAGVEFDDEEDA